MPRPLGMDKNMMRTAYPMQCPANGPNFTDQISALHRVYNTHICEIVNAAAVTPPSPTATR
jgi:hypothetical protein